MKNLSGNMYDWDIVHLKKIKKIFRKKKWKQKFPSHLYSKESYVLVRMFI